MRRHTKLIACVLVTACAHAVAAQTPLRYAIDVDPATREVAVTLHVSPAHAGTVRLVMARHPEYNDAFYRYVHDVEVTQGGHALTVAHGDSLTWSVDAPGNGELSVRYAITFPGNEGFHGSWRGFVARFGGVVGGPATFMYVQGAEASPASVTLAIPRNWQVSTALDRGNGGAYDASTVTELLDSPILVGELRRWHFVWHNTPHEIALLDSVPVAFHDSLHIAAPLVALAREARDVFGRYPYRRFTFLVVGGRYGGLEHARSVSLAAPADTSHESAVDYVEGAAHEYFHTWNEVALRPNGWGPIATTAPANQTSEKWWMEGATLYYADLLARRAHLPTRDSTRVAALERWIGEYLDQPANADISPEQASRLTDAESGVARADVYAQGRVLAAMLDLMIRDSTNGRGSLDDVMSRLYREHNGRGYTGADVELAAAATCECRIHTFFSRSVSHASAPPFADALRAIGMTIAIDQARATDDAGRPLPDRRVGTFTSGTDARPRVLILQPDGAWARAGLRTGDVIVRMGDTPMPTMRSFVTAVRALALNVTTTITYERDGAARTANVTMRPYDRTVVHIRPVIASNRQRIMRDDWLNNL